MPDQKTLAHLEDIDFRNHSARRASAKQDFKKWHKQILTAMKTEGYSDLLQGQLTMIDSVLWYLCSPKEYRALTRGMIYIDQSKFSTDQLRLFRSLMAFKGSPHCNLDSPRELLDSYVERAKPGLLKIMANQEPLAKCIAFNIVTSVEVENGV